LLAYSCAYMAAQYILHYLLETKDYILTYGDEHHNLLGYSDVDSVTQEH